MPPDVDVNVLPSVDQTKSAHDTAAQQTTSAKNFWRDPRPTNKNPNFVHDYFQSSRLHFIGSFRARYEAMMVAVGKRLNVHPSILLRPPPKSKTNTERVIVHIDMDCFFASIAVTKNPDLCGKCIAICHGGGEISSCSYEARAYGVHAGMFCRDARKLCPQLLNVDYDFPSYEKVSIQIYSFFHDYPGICVEAVSVDEAYLDITGTIGKDASQSSAETLVSSLRTRIEMETGCTASAGIGPSKLVARLATKGAKPNGQLRVRQENVIKYLDTLSVKDLPGIGWRTSKRLAALSVATVPQLRALSLTTLQNEFGERQGQVFHDLARAFDSRRVEPLKPRKSIGAEASWGVRFEQDETEKVKKFIQDMTDVVATRVTEAGAYGKKVTYKVYRRIPDSSMAGWKHLGHGPCTILTKSAKLPPKCVGAVFKTALKELCLDIHEAWRIGHDEFRGVGVQVTDLTFADLSFNHLKVPVNGTPRIDTFFPSTSEKDKGVAKKQAVSEGDGTQSIKRVDKTYTDSAALKRNDDDHIFRKGDAPIEPANRGSALQDPDAAAPATENDVLGEDTIEPKQRAEITATNQGRRRAPILLDIPEGWDKKVFEVLPRNIQMELLQAENRVPTHRQKRVFPQYDAVETEYNEANAERAQPRLPLPAKRKRDVRKSRQELQMDFEKRARRKQSAQITMTQCADISEFRKMGHEVVDATEFRERPLKEVVELLDDLKPRRRIAKTVKPRELKTEMPKANDERESVKVSRHASSQKVDFDIPSPPMLSSDSESSYGVAGAIEEQGFAHSQIYADEDISNYASKLKAWMESNAGDIKTGHVELLRGRVLEMVYQKELDRACAELRTIGKFADEDGMDIGGWKNAFNELLADVQNETVRLHGFRLGVRPLGTAHQSNAR